MSNYDFEIDDDGFVNVYTDGACSGNGKYGAAAGIGVWFEEDHYLNVSEPIPYHYRATNQVAEILAVTKAATQALDAGVDKLRINTDSKFIIFCITKWMPKWKRNGWKKVDGRDVVNQNELREMEHELSFFDEVDWNYVPAHNKCYGNNMADRLAKEGAADYRRNY